MNRLFLGEAGFRVMPDNAHDVDLIALFINGVAHGLAVNGQAFVLLAIALVPSLQDAIEVFGIDADKNIADDIEARHVIALVAVTAVKTASGVLAEVVGPFPNGFVAPHAAENGSGGDGKDRGQAMASSLGAARIGDVFEKTRQGLHMFGGKHDAMSSCVEKGL